MKLDYADALSFFRTYMFAPLQGKRSIYEARNIRLGSAVTPSDWEVFASLLMGKRGNGGVSGVDLDGIEVKSALNEGSFEYQYHKETGIAKLASDMASGHLFITHSNFLNLVTVRFVTGRKLTKNYFSKWLKNYPNPYPQRYRNSVSAGWVKENGKVLLVIEGGSVTFGP